MTPILLLSADAELARVLKQSLRETQVRVASAVSSTQAAADALAQHALPLVVIDLFLPNSSGIEALKVLTRVNESGMFVLLTRLRTRSLIERAFRLGAQDVLHYPVSLDVLRDTILHRLQSQPMGDSD